MHDEKFTLKKENTNYLWMDTVSLLLLDDTHEQKMLKAKITQHKNQKLRRSKREAAQKFGGKQKRLGQNDKNTLTNYRDNLYYGRLYAGSQFQEMQVVIDTSSDWLLIEGSDCFNCQETTYDPSTSQYYEEISSREFSRDYGNIIQTRVKEVKDFMCLGFDDVCIEEMKFLMVTEQAGIPPQVDGILGMT